MIEQTKSLLSATDFMGPDGGRMAVSFAAGVVLMAGVLWKFILPRYDGRNDRDIAALKERIAAEEKRTETANQRADAAEAELIQKYKDDNAELRQIMRMQPNA